MANLKEEALSYEGKSGNVADLPEVSTGYQVEDREGINEEGKSYKYKVIVLAGEEYRVPASVLKSLKAILEDNPKLQRFKVRKSGQGMNTTYTVIPLA